MVLYVLLNTVTDGDLPQFTRQPDSDVGEVQIKESDWLVHHVFGALIHVSEFRHPSFRRCSLAYP